LKTVERARTAYEFVVKNFAESSSAALAQQRLQELK
jgi:hypothetical protein